MFGCNLRLNSLSQTANFVNFSTKNVGTEKMSGSEDQPRKMNGCGCQSNLHANGRHESKNEKEKQRRLVSVSMSLLDVHCIRWMGKLSCPITSNHPDWSINTLGLASVASWGNSIVRCEHRSNCEDNITCGHSIRIDWWLGPFRTIRIDWWLGDCARSDWVIDPS